MIEDDDADVEVEVEVEGVIDVDIADAVFGLDIWAGIVRVFEFVSAIVVIEVCGGVELGWDKEVESSVCDNSSITTDSDEFMSIVGEGDDAEGTEVMLQTSRSGEGRRC